MWATVHGLVGTLRNLFVAIGSDSSSASRTKAYAAAGSYITQHPWFGRGLGTFLPATYFYIDNQYLTSLIETGIIGLGALLTLFISGWLIARSARRATSDPEERHLAQCLAACVVVAMLSFSTYDALSFTMATGITFLLLGCTGACWRLLRESNAPTPRSARFASACRVSGPAPDTRHPGADEGTASNGVALIAHTRVRCDVRHNAHHISHLDHRVSENKPIPKARPLGTAVSIRKSCEPVRVCAGRRNPTHR